MSDKEKVKYLRKLSENYPLPASDMLLRRGDMFPCDREGNFLGGDDVDFTEVEPEPVKEPEISEEEIAANKRRASLLEHAKGLGIKNPHTMKESTLLSRISKSEKEKEASAKKEKDSWDKD